MTSLDDATARPKMTQTLDPEIRSATPLPPSARPLESRTPVDMMVPGHDIDLSQQSKHAVRPHLFAPPPPSHTLSHRLHGLPSDRTAQVCTDWARLCRTQMPPVALNLRWAPKITADDVLCVAGRFRLVGSLSLAGDAITAAGLEKILENCPVLAELDLAEFRSRRRGRRTLMPKSTIRMVATCCVKLTALRLGSCWQFDSLPAEIGQLTRLHTLDLSSCEQLGSLCC